MLDHLKFKPLQTLVVDDFPQFCSALRTMVTSYGVEQVDTVGTGEEAVAALARNRYDLVLCDYNLGEGKNGNEVLEEAKHRKLLKSSALFIMITAENSADMVRGALEYQPDDYLTKPFTKEVLKTRLDRLLERNVLFKEVYRATDRKQFGKAIAGCEQVMASHPRARGYAQKLKAQLLMESGDSAGARGFFQAVLQARSAAWARLGLGKTYFLDQQYERAMREFQLLVEEDRGYVQAWDWLARCQAALGDQEQALASLQEAVSISPMNLRRQALFGEAAMACGDLERAERAYSRAVKLSRNSAFRTPDSYLKLAEILVERLQDTEGLVNKRLETKAHDTLEQLRRLYRHEASVAAQSWLMDAEVHRVQGRESEAQVGVMKALDAVEQGADEVSGAVKEQLIERLQQAGLSDQARQVIHAMQREESRHNAQAVALYEAGQLEDALEMLRSAQAEKPRSFAINLNLAQVALHLMVQQGVQEELLQLADSALHKVDALPADDRRYGHYQSLLRKLQQLKARQAGA